MNNEGNFLLPAAAKKNVLLTTPAEFASSRDGDVSLRLSAFDSFCSLSRAGSFFGGGCQANLSLVDKLNLLFQTSCSERWNLFLLILAYSVKPDITQHSLVSLFSPQVFVSVFNPKHRGVKTWIKTETFLLPPVNNDSAMDKNTLKRSFCFRNVNGWKAKQIY